MATVSPLLIPAVLDPPILLAVEGTIADHSDSMASLIISAGCVIHARLVRLKVGVHIKSDIHWAIG